MVLPSTNKRSQIKLMRKKRWVKSKVSLMISGFLLLLTDTKQLLLFEFFNFQNCVTLNVFSLQQAIWCIFFRVITYSFGLTALRRMPRTQFASSDSWTPKNMLLARAKTRTLSQFMSFQSKCFWVSNSGWLIVDPRLKAINLQPLCQRCWLNLADFYVCFGTGRLSPLFTE
jgi:hypothetical protein